MKKSLAFALIAQAVSIAVILTIALQFSQQLKLYSDYTNQVEHTYMVINQLQRTNLLLKEAETSSRGYIITRDKNFLEPLNELSKAAFVSLDSLRLLTMDNEVQKARVNKLEKVVYAKMVLQIENAHYVDRLTRDSLLKRLNYGRMLSQAFAEVIADMTVDEMLLMDKRKLRKETSEAKLPEQVRIVFLITGLSTLIFGFWIFVELRKRFRFQEKLQEKLMELRQNNEELEQIAFAASHDLQEPLRKIRVFSDRLVAKLENENVHEASIGMAKRMNNAAERMQELIDDLIKFNKLVQHETATEEEVHLSLEKIVQSEWTTIQEWDPQAELKLEGVLPYVFAVREQVSIVFAEIFENCYDFRSEERPLKVCIGSKKIKGKLIQNIPGELRDTEFYHIWIKDNGSGFDERYKEKMFKLFQRLHNYDAETDARRKGMGLALCRRVMLNLNGWIDAEGKQEAGTTIHLYFPV